MNAIILAAGMGTRLKPLTENTPKPLIKINGKPIIETSIEYLINIGIKEIIIVVGYKKEKFYYLVEKYLNKAKIIFIFNKKYKEYNNIYSLYLARDFFKNSFILEGDIYLSKNIFKFLTKSSYFSKKLNYINNEWQLKLENEKVKVIDINGGIDNYVLSGVSFFIEEDSKKINTYLISYIKDATKLRTYFWDHIIQENIFDFNIGVEKLKTTDIYEIDNLEDLRKIDDAYADITNKNTQKIMT